MQILPPNPTPQKWYRLPLAGCVSGDGRPYNASFKLGVSNNILVNFFGGGLSWNETTAALPITIPGFLTGKEQFYIPHVTPFQMNFIHLGLLSAKDKRNPFRDYTILNLPYSTADFHMGSHDYAYKGAKGQSRVLHHHGAKNARTALAALKAHRPQTPDTLVIMGQSAGAFGCVALAPMVQQMYPDCQQVVVCSEGSHLYAPIWAQAVNHIWRADPAIGAYIQSNNLIGDLFRYAQDHMPTGTLFMHSNSVYDGVLAKYMYKMNHGVMEISSASLKEFYDTLMETVRGLKGTMANYTYYLTDYGRKRNGATPHVFSGSPKLVYSEMQDGVPLVEWLAKGIAGAPVDVGAKFLN
ncbi:MAG: hypothetical protein FWG38_04285 [Defluviitaleaceae bacterium]|nr:hypothetical protein [Defluviitaleaceae bacterium]